MIEIITPDYDAYYQEQCDNLEHQYLIEQKEKEVLKAEIKLKQKLTELKNLKR